MITLLSSTPSFCAPDCDAALRAALNCIEWAAMAPERLMLAQSRHGFDRAIGAALQAAFPLIPASSALLGSSVKNWHGFEDGNYHLIALECARKVRTVVEETAGNLFSAGEDWDWSSIQDAARGHLDQLAALPLDDLRRRVTDENESATLSEALEPERSLSPQAREALRLVEGKPKQKAILQFLLRHHPAPVPLLAIAQQHFSGKLHALEQRFGELQITLSGSGMSVERGKGVLMFTQSQEEFTRS